MAIVTRQGEGKYKIHIKYYVELLAVVPFRSEWDGRAYLSSYILYLHHLPLVVCGQYHIVD